MKHLSKRLITLFLGIMMLFTVIPVSAFAANYDTNYAKYPVPTRTLKYTGGTTLKGDDVRWFQCAINYLVAKGKLSTDKLDVDGSFGKASRTAVYTFQAKYKNYDKNNVLAYDGCFGPASRTVMQKVLKADTSSCNHIYVLKEKVQATCGSSGYLRCVCSKCGNISTTILPETGKHVKKTVTDAAGFKKEYCSQCGKVFYSEVAEIRTALEKQGKSKAKINKEMEEINTFMINAKNLKNKTSEDADVIAIIGKIFEIGGFADDSKMIKIGGEICDYIGKAQTLKAIVSSNTNDIERVKSVLTTCSSVFKKLPGGKSMSALLDIMSDYFPVVLNKVKERYQYINMTELYYASGDPNNNLFLHDTFLENGAKEKRIIDLSLKEIAVNFEEVKNILGNHYWKSVKGTESKPSEKEINEYVQKFLEVKLKQHKEKTSFAKAAGLKQG